MTQKLKQWGTSHSSLKIALLFNPQILRLVLSLPDAPLFRIHHTALVLRFYVVLQLKMNERPSRLRV